MIRRLLTWALLGSATLCSSSSAASPTILVGRGEQGARLVRPAWGVTGVSWGVDEDAREGAAQTVVWTDVVEIRGGRRQWSWRTYASWCARGRCDRPRLLGHERLRHRTTSAVQWRAGIAVDGDALLVRFGQATRQRWVLVRRGRPGRLTGTSPPWGVGGNASLVHLPSGENWVAWADTGRRARLDRLQDGRRLGGAVVARSADSFVIRDAGATGLVASWLVREDPDDEPGTLIWSYGSNAHDLADPTHQTVLASMATPAVIAGEPTGPRLVVWDDINPGGSPSEVARALWIDPEQAPSPASAQRFPALPDADFSFGYPGAWLIGGTTPLLFCPLGLGAAASGQPLTPGHACPEDLFPVTLRGQQS